VVVGRPQVQFLAVEIGRGLGFAADAGFRESGVRAVACGIACDWRLQQEVQRLGGRMQVARRQRDVDLTAGDRCIRGAKVWACEKRKSGQHEKEAKQQSFHHKSRLRPPAPGKSLSNEAE
jgi:hypothetical protein